MVPRSGTRKRVGSITPSLTRITATATPPGIQQPLALCIEVKESQDPLPLRRAQRLVGADEFVVAHAAIREGHRSPDLDMHTCAKRKARSKHECVEQIALEAQKARHGTIIEWTWQRRNEIDVAGGPAFEKAASRNLDYDVDFRYQCFAPTGSSVIRVVHSASLLQSLPRSASCDAEMTFLARRRVAGSHRLVRTRQPDSERRRCPRRIHVAAIPYRERSASASVFPTIDTRKMSTM